MHLNAVILVTTSHPFSKWDNYQDFFFAEQKLPVGYQGEIVMKVLSVTFGGCHLAFVVSAILTATAEATFIIADLCTYNNSGVKDRQD